MQMTVTEFRRAHLVLMIHKAGKAQDFAEEVGLGPSYVSQLVNGNREVGHKTARKIEMKMGLPKGAMDLPPDGSTDEMLVALFHTMSEDKILSAFSTAMPHLSQDGLRTLSAALLAQLTAPASQKE
jgi:transcriptional regulator with XRE-family HTH domain